MEYRVTETTTSNINYHIVFCPRHKRKIFTIPNLPECFAESIKRAGEEIDVKITKIGYGDDFCYLNLNAPPELSPYKIIQAIKSETAKDIRANFPSLAKVTQLWTRNYFVSTDEVINDEMIEDFVNSQKNR